MDTISDEYQPIKLDQLNSDVLRDINDRLDLTEIVALQNVCWRFQNEAHYRKNTAKFELHSVAKHRFGVMANWLKETLSILERYGSQIEDLHVDYNYFTNPKKIDRLNRAVRAFCNHLKVYKVTGLIHHVTVRLNQPNMSNLHTLRLQSCNPSTNDEDISAYLIECQDTLRSFSVESMSLSGQFLEDAPAALESLQLIHLRGIERNPNLKRFEFESREQILSVPDRGFLDMFTKVENFKLKIENRNQFMCYLNVAILTGSANIKSLELDLFKLCNLEVLLEGLADCPMLERLSFTMMQPLADLRSLKRLEKLQYLRVDFISDKSAKQMDNLLQAICYAERITDLEIILPHNYVCDLTVLYARLPNIRHLKVKMGSQCKGLQQMASFKNLSSFEIRINCHGDAKNVANQLVTPLRDDWAIEKLVITILSSTEFSPELLTQFEKLAELEIKSAGLEDWYEELGRIAVGRIFTIPLIDAPHCVQVVFGLVNYLECKELSEIKITGEVHLRQE